jgi:hypothetical protein
MRSPIWSHTDSPGFRVGGGAGALPGLGALAAFAAGREAAFEPLVAIFPSLLVTTTMSDAQIKVKVPLPEGRSMGGESKDLGAYGNQTRSGTAFTDP